MRSAIADRQSRLDRAIQAPALSDATRPRLSEPTRRRVLQTQMLAATPLRRLEPEPTSWWWWIYYGLAVVGAGVFVWAVAAFVFAVTP